MAVNPMQRKSRNSFLLGMVITLLITGVIIIVLFLQVKKLNDQIAAEAAKLVNVYTINQDAKSGTILTEDMFSIKTVSRETIPANATSMADVVSAWYLQTEEGESVFRDQYGLYMLKGDGIRELTKSNNEYIDRETGEDVSISNPFVHTVDGEERYFMIDNPVSEETRDNITRIYEYSTGKCYVYMIENNIIKTKELKFNTVPILAKVNLKANTVITPDYIVQSDAIVTNDVRRQEYNMVVLPIDLTTDDYIDIRLMTPSGQDFIVVSKKQVEIPANADGTFIPDTIWVELNESEILAMSSAIVEAYGIQGAKLYATKYVEPGMQDSPTTTYVPNNAVLEQIKINPNILNDAKAELNNRYSAEAKNLRNQYVQSIINEDPAYKNNVTSGMDAGVTNTDAARRKYIESLGY